MNNSHSNGFNDPFSSSSSVGFGSDPFSSQNSSMFSSAPPPPSRKTYGLHWLQTLLVLLTTVAAAFVFTQVFDIRYAANPFLHPHLILNNTLFFTILSAIILFTVYFIEFVTSAMTPRLSRKLQLLVAIIAIALCALISCLSELFFVNLYIKPQLAPTPAPIVTPTPSPSPTPTPAAEVNNMVIFALDKSGSMSGFCDNESSNALKTLVNKMSASSKTGLIVFCERILETVPLRSNTSTQRSSIIAGASIPTQGMTEFTKVMQEAITLVRNANLPDNTPVKLIFITDGAGGKVDHYISDCLSLNIQVSCVMIGNASRHDLQNIVTQTGGSFVAADSPTDILKHTESIVMKASVKTPTPKPAPTPSPTPEPKIYNLFYATPDSDLYLAVMLILIGLVLGAALSLMLSLEGQFRIQLFLSPLMGLCAFLLIHYRVLTASNYWIAFSLFGIVLMRRNNAYFSSSTTPHGSSNPPPSGFDTFSF